MTLTGTSSLDFNSSYISVFKTVVASVLQVATSRVTDAVASSSRRVLMSLSIVVSFTANDVTSYNEKFTLESDTCSTLLSAFNDSVTSGLFESDLISINLELLLL